ncbi:MAG: hypothetical protein KBB88_01320 [Candidatus Pacebacteria bacterium]|nr:hypothetical protein [Candidatus Paceibacterota bacterium]
MEEKDTRNEGEKKIFQYTKEIQKEKYTLKGLGGQIPDVSNESIANKIVGSLKESEKILLSTKNVGIILKIGKWIKQNFLMI